MSVVLIIIGVLLALVALGYFSNQHAYGVLPNYQDSLHLPCGVSILSPKNGEAIAFPYTVRGYANGCGWGNRSGIAGSVSAVFDNGLIAGSAMLPIAPGNDTQPYYFEQLVNITVPPGAQKGTFIFHAAGAAFGTGMLSVPFTVIK